MSKPISDFTHQGTSTEAPGLRERIKLQFTRLLNAIAPGHVSETHLQEAKERFFSLSSMVEYYEKKLDCASTNGGGRHTASERRNKCGILQSCRELLDESEAFLSSRQDHLSHAWRIFARVKILLIMHVFPDDMLRVQIDFCREEAHRLALQHDDIVTERLQMLAEASDENGNHREQICRSLCALVERFNTLRTQRIYEQYVNIRTYKTAFFVLMALAVILIGKAGLLVEYDPGPASPQGVVQYAPVATYAQVSMLVERKLAGKDAGIIDYPLNYLNQLIESNILAFTFLSGLVGGYFSVVTRTRGKKRIPGEDAYMRWYILSKPFIGALGAVVLFILFQNEFVTLNMVTQFTLGETGKIFGFAFLSGFSERVVFPDFR